MINLIKKLFKNEYVFNIFTKIYVAFIGLLGSIFLTRYLTIDYKGEYSYILNVVKIITLILNFGLYQSYSFEYRKNNLIKKDYSNIFCFQFLLYFMICSLGFLFTKNKLVILILFLIPFNIIKMQFENIMLVENIKYKMKRQIYNITISFLAYFILYSTLNLNIVYPIVIMIFIDMITVFSYIKNMKVNINIFTIKFRFLKNLFKFGYIPMLTSILVTLNYSVDIIFLKYLGNNVDLSLYSLSAGLINYIWLVPDAFKEIIFSRVSKNNNLKSVNLSVKISILLVFIMMIFFILLGKFFLKILYGTDFIDSYGVIIILFLGVISMVFYKILGVVFLAEGRRIYQFTTLLISVIVNIILNIFLIPRYGMYGAAVASVFSYSVCGFSFLYYFCKLKNENISSMLLFQKSEIIYFYKNFIKKENSFMRGERER